MKNVNFCGNTPQANSQMQEYFNSLPAYVQENVKQCGMEFRTLEELKQCTDNLTQA